MAGRKEYQLAIKIAGEIEKSLPASMRNTRSELRAVSKDALKATSEMNGAFSASAKSVGASLDKINAVSNRVLKAVGKAVKVAGAGVAAGLGASIKVGSEFEAQMSTVQAISGSTADEMKRLNEAALEYGSKTSFTAKEAGEALEYMALAGYDANKSIEMLPNVLNLAAAGEMDLGRASDQVTDAQSALGLSVEETTRFVDQMAQTAASSNTSVEQLGAAALTVGGTARNLKGGITELNQVLGLLADNGIKGSEGGTKLRNMILSLSAPTDSAAGAMASLGLEIADKEGNLRSMSDIMADLGEKLDGLGNVEKSRILKAIFNKTDIKAVNALLGTSSERWSELSGVIENANGAAEKMAETKLDNLQGDITLFKSALEGTGVRIYEELQGPLRGIVQGATKGIEGFTDWFIENFPTIKSAITEIGEAIGTFTAPFLSVGEWLLDNPEVISGALGAIGAAIITFKVASGIKAVVSAISGFASLNPVITIIGGVAAAIGAVAAATAKARNDAKAENLAKSFGDVALSMEDIEDVAKRIVGGRDLERIDELMNSIAESDSIVESLKRTSGAIKKVNWKIKAGLDISKADREEYANEVKKYVEDTQTLIEQKGYEVQVSTKLLFGNGKQGKELLKGSDAFYAGLEAETDSLTKNLNKKLQKAIEDGFTPDTKKAIDKVLDSLAEINERITQAQSEANWDSLSAEWSGKELTAASFKSLQKEINENLEKEYEGIQEGEISQYTSINARTKQGELTEADRKAGYISVYEAEELKKEVAKSTQEKKSEASNRSAEFQYNTLMDTYGEKLAAGELDQSDRDALNELTTKMLKGEGIADTEYGKIIKDINDYSQYNDTWTSAFNPFDENGILRRTIKAKRNIGENLDYSVTGSPMTASEIYNLSMIEADAQYLAPLIKAQKSAKEYLSGKASDNVDQFTTPFATARQQYTTQDIESIVKSSVSAASVEQNVKTTDTETTQQQNTGSGTAQSAGAAYNQGISTQDIETIIQKIVPAQTEVPQQVVAPTVSVVPAEQDVNVADTEKLQEQGEAGGEAYSLGMSEQIGQDTTVTDTVQKIFSDTANGATESGRMAGNNFITSLRSSTAGQVITIDAKIKSAGGASVTPHAMGGIFSKPHIGMVGEAGTESVIPINHTKNSYDLFIKTGEMLGFNMSQKNKKMSERYNHFKDNEMVPAMAGNTTFAPNITINAPGGDKTVIKQAADSALKEFEKLYRKMKKEEERRRL